MDPEVLKELPRDIREQIERALKQSKKNKQTKSAVTTRSQSSQQSDSSGSHGDRKQYGGLSNRKQNGSHGDNKQYGSHGDSEEYVNISTHKQAVTMVTDPGFYDDMVASDGARPGCSNWGAYTSRSRSVSRSVSSDSAKSTSDVPNNMDICDTLDKGGTSRENRP